MKGKTDELGNAYLRGKHDAEQLMKAEINRLQDQLRTSNEWKAAYLNQLDALKAKLRELGRE